MNVNDIVRIRIADAARRIELAKKRRAAMDAARDRGLAQRHAAKLRNQAARRPEPPGVATPDPEETPMPEQSETATTLGHARLDVTNQYAAPSRDACPVCTQAATYARELDRYVHLDGADNRSCWLALSRGQATAPVRPVDGSVITDVTAFGLRLNGRRVVRVTNNLLRAVERHTRDDASTAAVLRFLLAGARDSSAQDGELWLTDDQAALNGLPMWAQLDPDGYVLLLPTDV